MRGLTELVCQESSATTQCSAGARAWPAPPSSTSAPASWATPGRGRTPAHQPGHLTINTMISHAGLPPTSHLNMSTYPPLGLTGAEMGRPGGWWWCWRWWSHCCSSWSWLSTSTSSGRQHWRRGRRGPRWFTSSQPPAQVMLLSLSSPTRVSSEPEFSQGSSGQSESGTNTSWKYQVCNKMGMGLFKMSRSTPYMLPFLSSLEFHNWCITKVSDQSWSRCLESSNLKEKLFPLYFYKYSDKGSNGVKNCKPSFSTWPGSLMTSMLVDWMEPLNTQELLYISLLESIEAENYQEVLRGGRRCFAASCLS